MGDLGVGESAIVQVIASASTKGTFTNSAFVVAEQSDPDASNNTASDSILVFPEDTLAIPLTVPILNSFVGVAIRNASSQENSVQLSGLGFDGSKESETELEIPGEGQTAFVTSETGLQGQTLLAAGQDGSTHSFFMIGTGSPDKLDGIGRRLEDDTTLFLPEIKKTGTDWLLRHHNLDPGVNRQVRVERAILLMFRHPHLNSRSRRAEEALFP